MDKVSRQYLVPIIRNRHFKRHHIIHYGKFQVKIFLRFFGHPGCNPISQLSDLLRQPTIFFSKLLWCTLFAGTMKNSPSKGDPYLNFCLAFKVYWEALTYLDSWYIQNHGILKTWGIFWIALVSIPSEYSLHRESLEYRLHRTLNSLYPCHLKTAGIFRTLSNIYNGAFCSKSCVTQTYLESCHIENLRNIRNPVKHLWCSIFLGPCVTQAYLESWYIQKLSNIENPVKHLFLNELGTVFYSEPCQIYMMKYFIQNPL